MILIGRAGSDPGLYHGLGIVGARCRHFREGMFLRISAVLISKNILFWLAAPTFARWKRDRQRRAPFAWHRRPHSTRQVWPAPSGASQRQEAKGHPRQEGAPREAGGSGSSFGTPAGTTGFFRDTQRLDLCGKIHRIESGGWVPEAKDGEAVGGGGWVQNAPPHSYIFLAYLRRLWDEGEGDDRAP